MTLGKLLSPLIIVFPSVKWWKYKLHEAIVRSKGDSIGSGKYSVLASFRSTSKLSVGVSNFSKHFST